LSETNVVVVIATLAADHTLSECVRSLLKQTYDDVEIVVVDNSGNGLARQRLSACRPMQIIENETNVGFGQAINQGMQSTASKYVATLNDDAVAHPDWLARLVEVAESHHRLGMLASQVRMLGTGHLDSAGMLISRDGSSKQRGHGAAVGSFAVEDEVIFPSGSAALYRRAMLHEIGGFDDDYFLYCEDTDLGLRGRWAGWGCRYVPGAIVEHRYSHSAGRASSLKAYYVERNRLFTVVKNYPALPLLRVPIASIVRYFWHVIAVWNGHGATAEFQRSNSALLLVWLVAKAHLAFLLYGFALLRKRRQVQAHARLSSAEFSQLLERHTISLREVATL
jgi:GT2 family glycosyltransferase